MSTPSIFATVPQKDYLGFYSGSNLDYQNIVKFAEMEKKDVSRATGIPVTSIRYEEEKIPNELKDRLTEWAVLFNLVAGYFRGDKRKTVIWFKVPNPLLGNISPRDMIRIGRYKRLNSFVLSTLAEEQKAS
jgi:uncharacterized protein (DUF2384 family)